MEPNFNIVTPHHTRQLLKTQKNFFSDRLEQLLKITEVKSIRVRTSDLNETDLIQITSHIREIVGNNISILIEDQIEVVLKLDANGVHLTSGQKFIKKAKSILSEDHLIGSFCGLSKHSGLIAAENGADYISFAAHSNSTRTNKQVVELFKWWSEFIEIPVMGECHENYFLSPDIWNYCDFVSLGNEVWNPEFVCGSSLQPLKFNLI